MTTVAGTGVAGYSKDEGLATSAQFNEPQSIALDSSGNIYVTDTYDNVIRMITKSTGIITTVAGTGRRSRYYGRGTGDGGLAIKATFYYPGGIALDASGNIYVADTLNYVIRMITKSTGIITKVAGTGISSYTGDGGLATSATIGLCFGVALDASGNIYVSDAYYNVIRMITKSTGIITTVAGTGQSTSYDGYNTGDGGLATSATLNDPGGIALDTSGNIYVADSWNYLIRMIKKSTGIITTVAGTKNGINLRFGYTGDGGLATSATIGPCYNIALDASENIFITGIEFNVIRKITKSTGIITTVAGTPTKSNLNKPTGIAIDSAGTAYFADTDSHQVRSFSTST